MIYSCPVGQNNLLCTLSDEDQALLAPCLEPVSLEREKVLEAHGEVVEIVYFPTSGIGSSVAVSAGGRRIEAGLFGCEGMSGAAILLQGERSTHETFMQVAGKGFAMEAAKLTELLGQSRRLQRHLLRFVQVMMTQTSQTALSNGRARLEERLARWLLMCHDRMNGDTLTLTHEFLSVMLGVRRAGVTVGTHMLEGKGMIRAERGQITILDRDGLEHEARESYGIPEAEYARLIGFDRSGRPENAN